LHKASWILIQLAKCERVANTLGKPQVPTPRPVSAGKNWANIWAGFNQSTQDHQNLVLYLQQYLGNIQQSIIPLQYATTTVAHTQSPYPVNSTDVVIAAAAGSAAPTIIDLPPATGSGRTITVKKTDANAQDVTLDPDLSDTIDGASSYDLSTQYQSVSITDHATAVWWITGSYVG
jgi:hypothetical protein